MKYFYDQGTLVMVKDLKKGQVFINRAGEVKEIKQVDDCKDIFTGRAERKILCYNPATDSYETAQLGLTSQLMVVA